MERDHNFDPEGRSDAARRLRVTARTLARMRYPVLVAGELGVGKLRFARLLHDLCEKPNLPFRRLNCSEEGASLGPVLNDVGSGGTLVLEHVDEAPVLLQRQIARALGSSWAARGLVRIIATSRRDLALEVLEARFLSDLFFRLRVYSVDIPPLRERKEDISIVARSILEEFTKARGGPEAPELTIEAIELATNYKWPGNVRQLKNDLIRCATRAQRTIGKNVLAECLDERLPISPIRAPQPARRLRERVDAFERQMLDEALATTLGNRDRAAALLGITRRTLQRKLSYFRGLGVGMAAAGETALVEACASAEADHHFPNQLAMA